MTAALQDCSTTHTAASYHQSVVRSTQSQPEYLNRTIEKETKVGDKMNDAGISSRLTQHVSHFIFIS